MARSFQSPDAQAKNNQNESGLFQILDAAETTELIN